MTFSLSERQRRRWPGLAEALDKSGETLSREAVLMAVATRDVSVAFPVLFSALSCNSEAKTFQLATDALSFAARNDFFEELYYAFGDDPPSFSFNEVLCETIRGEDVSTAAAVIRAANIGRDGIIDNALSFDRPDLLEYFDVELSVREAGRCAKKSAQNRAVCMGRFLLDKKISADSSADAAIFWKSRGQDDLFAKYAEKSTCSALEKAFFRLAGILLSSEEEAFVSSYLEARSLQKNLASSKNLVRKRRI